MSSVCFLSSCRGWTQSSPVSLSFSACRSYLESRMIQMKCQGWKVVAVVCRGHSNSPETGSCGQGWWSFAHRALPSMWSKVSVRHLDRLRTPVPLNFFNNFIHLFMVVLGLCWCSLAVSSCGEWGPLFVVMHGLLIAMASPCCGAQALGHMGFSSCSTWAQ